MSDFLQHDRRPAGLGRYLLLPWLCAALAAAPAGLATQAIAGHVMDASTDVALEGVWLVLIDNVLGTAVEQNWSGVEGGFTLHAPLAAHYRIRATLIGYEVTTSAPFWVGPGDSVQVELRISTQPVNLPALRVVVPGTKGDPRLASWGFYQREADYRGLNRAKFYGPEELDASNAFLITDLMRDLPEITVLREGHRTYLRTRRGRSDIPVFLNGHPLRMSPDQTLDELIAMSSVTAVEIYWRWAPAQYNDPRRPGVAIVIWTGRFR
jgi:hypothetical protein